MFTSRWYRESSQTHNKKERKKENNKLTTNSVRPLATCMEESKKRKTINVMLLVHLAARLDIRRFVVTKIMHIWSGSCAKDGTCLPLVDLVDHPFDGVLVELVGK